MCWWGHGAAGAAGARANLHLAQPAFIMMEVGMMPSDKYYHSARHKAWRAAVLKRAGYLCEECKRYGRLDSDGLPVKATTAHHILHRDEHPEAQYLVSNGRALCEACHMKAHPEKHGRGTTEKDYG